MYNITYTHNIYIYVFSEFDFDDLNVPIDLKKRGVSDCKLLPGYYYRDDALDLWSVILKFVRTSLILHYWTDSDVKVGIFNKMYCINNNI